MKSLSALVLVSASLVATTAAADETDDAQTPDPAVPLTVAPRLDQAPDGRADALPSAPPAAPAPTPEPPARRNLGLMIAGGITSLAGVPPIIGGALMIAGEGTWMREIYETAGYVSLAIGLAHMAVGIPMLVVGATPRSVEQPADEPVVSVKVGASSATLQIDF